MRTEKTNGWRLKLENLKGCCQNRHLRLETVPRSTCLSTRKMYFLIKGQVTSCSSLHFDFNFASFKILLLQKLEIFYELSLSSNSFNASGNFSADFCIGGWFIWLSIGTTLFCDILPSFNCLEKELKLFTRIAELLCFCFVFIILSVSSSPSTFSSISKFSLTVDSLKDEFIFDGFCGISDFISSKRRRETDKFLESIQVFY